MQSSLINYEGDGAQLLQTVSSQVIKVPYRGLQKFLFWFQSSPFSVQKFLFFWLSLSSSLRPSVCPSVIQVIQIDLLPFNPSRSVYLFIHPSVESICFPVSVSLSATVNLSVCLSVRPSVCLSVFPSARPSVCLFVIH